MAAFVPGPQRTRTDWNFVATYDLHKPSVLRTLVEPFGDQLLTGLMDSVGQKKSVDSLEYRHYEATRLMPKLKATIVGGAAGALGTFTVDTTARISIDQGNSPYDTDTSVTKSGMPVRANDIILIKNTTGTVTASSYIRAIVYSVNIGAFTFIAYPTDVTDSIPSVASASEVIIIGNAFGEGSAQPLSRSPKAVKYTNNLQIIKETYQITGSEKDAVIWTKVKNSKTGKSGYVWGLKGEDDTYKMFLNWKEMQMLLGEKLTNETVADLYATAGSPMKLTEGLIPFILSQGYNSNYSSTTGMTLTDFETLTKNLEKNKGAKQNLVMAGITLSGQIDRELGDRFTAGAINYGNFKFKEEKKVSLEFSTFSVMGYTYHKKTYDPFNDLQTLGADGYNFDKEAMVIPMDSQTDAKTREKVPSLLVRYLQGPEGQNSRDTRVEPVDLFKSGDSGQDLFEVRYISECGFQGFAGNRFAYIKQA